MKKKHFRKNTSQLQVYLHTTAPIPPMYKDVYRNDPKFWDIKVWANSADPDQTAPRGAV